MYVDYYIVFNWIQLDSIWFWSGWQDSNLRNLGPRPSGKPSPQHPDGIYYRRGCHSMTLATDKSKIHHWLNSVSEYTQLGRHQENPLAFRLRHCLYNKFILLTGRTRTCVSRLIVDVIPYWSTGREVSSHYILVPLKFQWHDLDTQSLDDFLGHNVIFPPFILFIPLSELNEFL